MEEDVADAMMTAGNLLHWLNKYQVANACILLSRLLRAKQITTLDELEAMVCQVEANSPALATPPPSTPGGAKP